MLDITVGGRQNVERLFNFVTSTSRSASIKRRSLSYPQCRAGLLSCSVGVKTGRASSVRHQREPCRYGRSAANRPRHVGAGEHIKFPFRSRNRLNLYYVEAEIL
ncbi:hypothetical protein KCP78_20875 [Salmonella enterica subsp. enterica]|nr:hypothetical protein KCP78_20875 [Salmonella enterica subsp. enterica]